MRNKLKAEITEVQFAICIDDYEADVCDLDWGGFFGEDFDPAKILEAVPGATDIDYNGHFGN